MTTLITVILAMATTFVVLGIAVAKGDVFKNAPAWLALLFFGISGALYLLAIALGINTVRKDSKENPDDKHKEIKSRLAVLLAREREIFASLKSASDNTQFTELIRKADEWVNEVVALLKDANQPTDAEIFSQVGHLELSAEQLVRVSHVAPWKREVVARQLLYRETLDQIREKRRL